MQRLVSSVALSAESAGRDAAAAKRLSDSTGGLRVTFVMSRRDGHRGLGG